MINKQDEALMLKSLMHSIVPLCRSECIVLSLLTKTGQCAYDDFEKKGVQRDYLPLICRSLNAKLGEAGVKFKIASFNVRKKGAATVKRLVRID